MSIQPLITPIPIIDKTGASINVLQALITAVFAVCSGLLLYFLKCMIDERWLRYVRKYKELRARTQYLLVFYANAYANVVAENDDWHREASRFIREMGAQIGAFAIERPYICLPVPREKILRSVSSELIGLSNRMVAKGESAFLMHDANEKSVAKIRDLLKLNMNHL